MKGSLKAHLLELAAYKLLKSSTDANKPSTEGFSSVVLTVDGIGLYHWY